MNACTMRIFVNFLLVLTIALYLSGCATGYQDNNLFGGFEETRIKENSWIVRFKGNAYTSASKSADYCLMRCAEVCLENGYSHFILVDSNESTKTSTFTTPQSSHTTGYVAGNNFYANTNTYGGQTHTMHRPRSTNTILALTEDEAKGFPQAYEAQFVLNSVSSKYGVAGMGSYDENIQEGDLGELGANDLPVEIGDKRLRALVKMGPPDSKGNRDGKPYWRYGKLVLIFEEDVIVEILHQP